ncbi:MAG TPA: V-type ATPase subunit [Anaeromyxobacteraceae bacterium]
MARCDFAAGRIGARRGRLLGPRGLRELVARPDLPARLELLRQSGYAGLVPPAGRGGDGALADVERGLLDLSRRESLRLLRDIEGRRPGRLFAAFLRLGDAENVKTLLRGLAGSESAERLRALTAPSVGLDEEALARLAAQPDPAAAARLLDELGSPFAGAVAEALPGLSRPGGLLRLDAAVDRAFLSLARSAARRAGEDGRLLAGVLGGWADARNAATLLSLSGEGDPGEFFLPGGARLGEGRFRRLARLGPEALRQALRDLAPPVALGDPFRADHLLGAALRRATRRAARGAPLSLAVPLSFALDRNAEVRRVRLVLRGALFGLPADDLLDLVEA